MDTQTKVPVEKFFYQMSVEEAVKRLGTNSESGLSHEEAMSRLAKYGPNQLQEGKRRPMVLRFLDQFRDLMIIVLIVAAFLAYYLGDFHGGTILLAIVFINAVIGFYQEFKAEKILEALKKIIKDKATVIRGGQRIEIDQTELVPGDIVYLEEGNSVPADVRLIKTTNFNTNDFILTGESLPQEKKADLIFDKELTLTYQDNLVFMGLTVAKGNAYAVVYGTGMDTAIGRIAQTSQDIQHDISPLQKEMNTMATSLTKIAGVIAVTLFLVNLLITSHQGEEMRTAIHLSIIFAVSIAAACVPQGLPAQISVALSLGVSRLAGKKAVVKKLSAVETLGSTTVICPDKTGTLTKNEMTITHCWTQGRVFEVMGNGYRPDGKVLENGKEVPHETLMEIKQFFEDGFLASNGRAEPPDEEHKEWYAIGDPTEAAFTPLTIKAGMDPKDLDARFPLHFELPFDSDRKRMTIIRDHKGKRIGYMKGALESVLLSCSHINLTGEPEPLTKALRDKILAADDEYARQALRVIALAYRDFPANAEKFSIDESEKDFVFAGFVAMIDPPRLGVKEAVAETYAAGVRIMMITGDNAVTAKAIAERIDMKGGVVGGPAEELPAYTGDDIKGMNDDRLKRILTGRSVIFSRVSLQDKYRIVSLLKEMGEVVAVTGDGVNDTLSLKKSDIGVSMGLAGSEVAKEASEIVLLDDNFSTLTVAVKEGRTIFANLKKTIVCTLNANIGELTCALLGFVGLAFGLPAPITAVQILAVDLIGEILPLAALTFDPPEDNIMKKSPRNLSDHIINRRSLKSFFFYGLWIGMPAFFSFFMVHKVGGASAATGQAAAYVTIIACQFMNILCRRTDATFFSRYLFTNPQLWVAFAISLSFVLTLIYLPMAGLWFGFEALSLGHWVYPLLGALLMLGWHEARKGLKMERLA